jgi:hypothetical protein
VTYDVSCCLAGSAGRTPAIGIELSNCSINRGLPVAWCTLRDKLDLPIGDPLRSTVLAMRDAMLAGFLRLVSLTRRNFLHEG